jgi:hypothetical protein
LMNSALNDVGLKPKKTINSFLRASISFVWV